MVGNNSDGPSLVIRNVKYTTNCDWTILHFFTYHENLCSKFLKIRNVVTVVSKLLYFIIPNGINHRQFKYLLNRIGYEYGS
jgi:hypothetical protein